MTTEYTLSSKRAPVVLEQHLREDHVMNTSIRYRVEGHAGLWWYRGPAVVITDDDTFEHDQFVVMAQAADPGNVAVVEATLVTATVAGLTETAVA